MAGNTLSVSLELLLEARQYIRNLRQALAANQNFGDSTENAASQARGSMDQLAGSVKNLVAAYLGFQAIKGVVSGVIGSVAKDVQPLNTRLKSLTENAEEYAETQIYLAQTANELNGNVLTLSASYAQLLTLRNADIISTEQAQKLLEGYANAAAQTGATNVQLEQSMYGLAQGLSAGTLRAEELNQITESMPGLMQNLDKAIGGTAGSFRKLVNSGKVSSDMLRDTLIIALEEYQGAAAATSNNIGARWNRLQNAYIALIQVLESPVTSALGPALDISIKLLQQFAAYVQQNQQAIQEFAQQAGAALADLIQFLAQLITVGSQVTAFFLSLVAGNTEAATAVLALYIAFKILRGSMVTILGLNIAAFFISMASGAVATGVAVSAIAAPLIALVAAVTAVVSIYQAYSAASDIAAEASKRQAEALKLVSEETRLQAKLGRSAKNASELNGQELTELRDSLSQRVSVLQSVQAEMEAMESDWWFESDEFEAVNKQLKEMKGELNAVNKLVNNSDARAISENITKVESELQAQEALRKASAERLLKIEKEAKKGRIALEQAITNRKLSAHARVLESARNSAKEAIKAEEEYAQKVTELRDKLANTAISDEEKLRNLRRKTMTDADAQADIQLEINNKLKASADALKSGDTSKAEELANKAKGLAGQLKGTENEIKAFEQAAAATRAAVEAELTATEETQAKLQGIITQDDNKLKVEADIAQASSAIEALQKQLAELKDKTITINVKQREAFQNGGQVSPIKRLATGGKLSGYGGGDRVPALLEAGEFVVRKERARLFGEYVHAINYAPLEKVQAMLGAVQRFKTGGLVQAVPQPQTSNQATPAVAGVFQVQLSDSAGNVATLMGERNQAEQFANMLNRAKRGAA